MSLPQIFPAELLSRPAEHRGQGDNRDRMLGGLRGRVPGRQAIRRSVLRGANIFGEPCCVLLRRTALESLSVSRAFAHRPVRDASMAACSYWRKRESPVMRR